MSGNATSTASDPGRAATRVAVTMASVMSSLLLHGGVLAATLLWSERRPGAIAIPTEAISIELDQSEVTEVVAVSASLEAAASSASVQSEAGAESNATAGTNPEKQIEVKPQPPDEHVTAHEAPRPDVGESAPHGLESLQGTHTDAEPAGQERKQHKQEARPAKDRTRPVKIAKPGKKGGAQSRAATGSAAAAGRVSASTGSTINYAALVRARVAARKPAGGGRRGTVVVAFSVSRSGALASASVARSSGDAGLDRNVLFAVRGAGPFPTPPPGASLRFTMPFYFR